MPTIDLTDDELAAVAATVRRAIEDDRFPHAPRLDPLHAALGKLEAEAADRKSNAQNAPLKAPKPGAVPKAAPAAKADKRARSAKAPEPKISPGFKLGRLPPDRARR